jgi:hypothetical protein
VAVLTLGPLPVVGAIDATRDFLAMVPGSLIG